MTASDQELSCGSAECVRKDNCLAPLLLSASTLLQEALGRFEGTYYCQGPTFTLFSSLMATGKSIPVMLPSWLGRGDMTLMWLTYLANAMLITAEESHKALTAKIVSILRGKEIKHMTAISFLHILNLVTKSAISRESLKWAKEGQVENSAALSLDH